MHHAAVLQHEHLDVVTSGRDVGREVQPRAEKLAPEEGDLLPFGGAEALASLVADERLAANDDVLRAGLLHVLGRRAQAQELGAPAGATAGGVGRELTGRRAEAKI